MTVEQSKDIIDQIRAGYEIRRRAEQLELGHRFCTMSNRLVPGTFSKEEEEKVCEMLASQDKEIAQLGFNLITCKLKNVKILSDCCGEYPTDCKDGMGICPSCKEPCECVDYTPIEEHPELNVSEG